MNSKILMNKPSSFVTVARSWFQDFNPKLCLRGMKIHFIF